MPGTSGEGRASAVIERIRALITDEDAERCVAELRDSLGSIIYVRGPKKKGQMDYVSLPDRASRLTAVRLMLAYKFGAPPTHNEITLHAAPGDEMPQLTAEENLKQLVASGADMRSIIDSWLSTIPNVTPKRVLSPEERGFVRDPHRIPKGPDNSDVMEV